MCRVCFHLPRRSSVFLKLDGLCSSCGQVLTMQQNTICGRNPITFLLQLIAAYHAEKEGATPAFTFVRYEQSSKCVKGSDSSVSYVSGVLSYPE